MTSVAERHGPYVFLGGGLTSGTAIVNLLAAGVPGSEIVLVAEEPELPYNRPPLSKGFLLGREKRASIFVKPSSFYTERGVTIFQKTRATRVDPSTHRVELSTGDVLFYKKLLLATGCTPRRLSVPGANLPGVHTFRTVADAETLRAAVAGGLKTAVLVGGGFISLEIASALAQRGVQTTILHRGTAMLDRLGSPEISSFFAGVFLKHGVSIRYEDEAVEMVGTDRVTAVCTKRGDSFPANLVIVGIGVVPETGFLEGSGISITPQGITVNEYLETSVLDVYAAGDVTSFFDPLYGKHRHIEHWDTAIQHGKIAAKNMRGQRTAYDAVSYFFSDLFNLSYDYFGDAEGTDRVIRRGSFEERSVTLFSLQENIVRAAFMLGRPRERKQTIALIKNRQPVETNVLADLTQPLP